MAPRIYIPLLWAITACGAHIIHFTQFADKYAKLQKNCTICTGIDQFHLQNHRNWYKLKITLLKIYLTIVRKSSWQIRPQGRLGVGSGDTAFFKKMNIFIEWIFRYFFEWIFFLNEYFCRTIEWIVEWIKKVQNS